MAKIPPQVVETELTILLKNEGLERFKDPGKVSEIWKLPGHTDKLMILTTSRKSIFDFVLNCFAPKTGEVITAMTVMFFRKVLVNYNTHLLAWGVCIDRYLPEKLRNNPELQKHALIVEKHEVEKLELIWRFHLTGSAWKDYQKTGMAYGYPLPPDLWEGVGLPYPMFTPTTKEEDGHDVPISRESVSEKYGEGYEQLTRRVANEVHDYCKKRGIIVPDLKLECSKKTPWIVLLDKLGPDEARFWDKKEWEKARAKKKAPQSYDKQVLRNWGKRIKTPFKDENDSPIVGIDNLDPNNKEHVAFVHGIKVPPEVIKETTQRYLTIFQRLNDGKSLENFQRNVMQISTT